MQGNKTLAESKSLRKAKTNGSEEVDLVLKFSKAVQTVAV